MQKHLIRSAALDEIPGLQYGFTTLSLSPAEREALENRTATAKQVHKDELAIIDTFEKRAREADALATFVPGLPVGVFSADCTPVLVAAVEEAGKQVVGVMAVHAGWRGTALGIAGSSLLAFAREAKQRCPSARFLAAVGPCISFESFEVGPEVVEAFPGSEERGIARFLRMEEGRRKYLFDLPGENARQLGNAAEKAGLLLALEPLGLCTVKETKLFPSYRREREKAGRILSFLEFREPGKTGC